MANASPPPLRLFLSHAAVDAAMPERAWVDDFLYQLTGFPNSAHDDDVDALTQFVVRWQRPELPTFVTW